MLKVYGEAAAKVAVTQKGVSWIKEAEKWLAELY